MEAVELWSEVMILCEAVTLELRKLEAGAREERHRMQDDSNSRWFYRRHLEQGRGVTCPFGGKEVMVELMKR